MTRSRKLIPNTSKIASRASAKSKLKELVAKNVDNSENIEVPDTEPVTYEANIDVKQKEDIDINSIVVSAIEQRLAAYEKSRKDALDEKKKQRDAEKEEKLKQKEERLKQKELDKQKALEDEKNKTAAQEEYYKKYINDLVYNKNKTELQNRLYDVSYLRKSIRGAGQVLNF